MEKKDDNNWLPLESNPEVCNKYIADLGFDTSKFVLQDVYSLDDEFMLAAIPQPVLALFLLFPITKNQKIHYGQEEQRLDKEGQYVTENLFFMKQYAGNACGTVALLHAIVNIAADNPGLIKPGSFLSRFIEKYGKEKDPELIGKGLMAEKDLEVAHKEAVSKGETQVEAKVRRHFLALVHKDGFLYELDGRRGVPINHGETMPETMFFDALGVVRAFMARDPTEIDFSVMVMVPKEF